MSIKPNLAPKTRFIKLDAKGKKLPAAATDHVAVYDPIADLTWCLTNPGGMNFADATAWAKKLEHLGVKGWRLATLPEWTGSAIDYGRYGPAIDLSYFRGFGAGWYWTSTPDAEATSDYAWLVGLQDGYVFRNFQTGHGSVRAVRAGQPS